MQSTFFFGYTRPVPATWYLLPDGSYKRLSSSEDLMSDVRFTAEDVTETISLLRDMCRESREASRESRETVAQSRRARRLRETTLRLVRENS
jgi:hypothetical protein